MFNPFSSQQQQQGGHPPQGNYSPPTHYQQPSQFWQRETYIQNGGGMPQWGAQQPYRQQQNDRSDGRGGRVKIAIVGIFFIPFLFGGLNSFAPVSPPITINNIIDAD